MNLIAQVMTVISINLEKMVRYGDQAALAQPIAGA